MISLTKLFSLLTEYVPRQPTDELLRECKSQMKEIPYVNFGFEQNFPAKTRGYSFSFKTDDEIPVMLDIFDSKGIIIQASFRIVYPGARSSGIFLKQLEVLLQFAEDYISPGDLNNVKDVKMFTFSSEDLYVVITASAFNEQDIIDVSVGNKPLWS